KSIGERRPAAHFHGDLTKKLERSCPDRDIVVYSKKSNGEPDDGFACTGAPDVVGKFRIPTHSGLPGRLNYFFRKGETNIRGRGSDAPVGFKDLVSEQDSELTQVAALEVGIDSVDRCEITCRPIDEKHRCTNLLLDIFGH